MGELDLNLQVSIWGLILGVVVGATAQKTNFCTMGAVSDAVFMEDWSRMRSWMLAVTVAIVGAQGLHIAGLIDLYNTIFLGNSFVLGGLIIGGLLFGFGMTMAGGCGNKTLVRMGAGNLKSILVFLIMGISAYMTLRGITGLLRIELESVSTINLDSAQGIPDLLAALTGMSLDTLRWIISGVLILALLFFIFKDREFRGDIKLILGGVIIGLAIPAALYITGVIGFDDFEPLPLNALSFVAPSGESIQYLMTFTGSTVNFGIAVVGGVILGSFLAAILSGQFSIEAFNDTTEMKRHMVGAVMMGVGGVMSLGCTFGQGISGVSTLSLGSFLAIASILFGAVWGLKSLEEDSVLGGLKAIFSRS